MKKNGWEKKKVVIFLDYSINSDQKKKQMWLWSSEVPASEATCNQLSSHTQTHTHIHRNGLLPFISHSVILACWLAALDECFYPESKQDSETVLILSSCVKL